jgi:hypothetical protein
VNASISFNCFSFVESVQGVHTKRKECVDGTCFDSKSQKR